MIESFASGFVWVLRVILTILGGATAVILFALALFILAFMAGAIFHVVTELMARRWEKTGKQPSHKLGKIIMRSRRERQTREV